MNKQEKKALLAQGVESLRDDQLISIIGDESIPAAMEYVRRLQTRERVCKKITRSQDADDVLRPLYIGVNVEEFNVIYLKRNNEIISVRNIGRGGISSCVVDVRVVMRIALELGASAMILSHNHPSGESKPSEADNKITRRIKEAAALMEIQVLDHVIIAGNGYYSYTDEGML